MLPRIRRILNPKEESMKPTRMFAGLVVVLSLSRRLGRPGPWTDAPPRADRPSPIATYANIIANVEAGPDRPDRPRGRPEIRVIPPASFRPDFCRGRTR